MQSDEFVNMSSGAFSFEDAAEAIGSMPRYTDTTRFYRAPSVLSAKLHRLRHASTRVNHSLEYMIEIPNFEQDSPITRAIIDASATKYFSCFQKGPTSPNLDYKNVFRNEPANRKKHFGWRKLRDQYLNHPGSDNTRIESFIMTDKQDTVTDVYSAILTGDVYGKDQIRDLMDIVVFLKDWLDTQLSKELERVHRAAEELNLNELNGPFDRSGMLAQLKRLGEADP